MFDRKINLQEDGGLRAVAASEGVKWLEVVLVGLVMGMLVGLMGVGGGVVLVPALLHLLRMEQHLAQGTSLFLQLSPIGLGALMVYWKDGKVDLRAGLACAAGLLFGGYFGSRVAIGLPSQQLRGLFGVFLILAATLLWHRTLWQKAGDAHE